MCAERGGRDEENGLSEELGREPLVDAVVGAPHGPEYGAHPAGAGGA